MKKNILKVLVPAVMLCFALTACGEDATQTTKDYSGTIQTGNSTNGNDADVSGETQQTGNDETDATPVSTEVFSFTYNGTKISINGDMDAVMAEIGEPNSTYVETTCAFEGCENDYTYGSFEVDENEMTDKSYISRIYLLDDLVSTEEGLKIGMTKDDAISIYGTPDEETDGDIKYYKGDSMLDIILSETGTVSSIMYESTMTVN